MNVAYELQAENRQVATHVDDTKQPTAIWIYGSFWCIFKTSTCLLPTIYIMINPNILTFSDSVWLESMSLSSNTSSACKTSWRWKSKIQKRFPSLSLFHRSVRTWLSGLERCRSSTTDTSHTSPFASLVSPLRPSTSTSSGQYYKSGEKTRQIENIKFRTQTSMKH